MPSKIVSTLLEILPNTAATSLQTSPNSPPFQPFLRFYAVIHSEGDTSPSSVMFQPFLRFYRRLRGLAEWYGVPYRFQPFLRFYRSCNRFLWVFKFFFGFCRFGGQLETTLYIHFTRRWVKSRRHSSASREGEDKKKGEKVRRSSQLAIL